MLILVDQADSARLRELVLALMPEHPEVEVYTDPRSLLDVPEGSTLVLAPRAEDADWLNLRRPLFAERALRVVLWCDAGTSKALARRATDFFDWISHRVECPPGVPAFAVAGIRAALCARALGVVWSGERFEDAFRAALPGRRILWLSAKISANSLFRCIHDRGGGWLGVLDIDSDPRLQLALAVLFLAGIRGRVVFLRPQMPVRGFPAVHDRCLGLHEARQTLEHRGVRCPGRLAALLDLEPEAVQIAVKLLENRAPKGELARLAATEIDPGAALARLAVERRLLAPPSTVGAMTMLPPVLRAFAQDPAVKLRTRAEVDSFASAVRDAALKSADLEVIDWLKRDMKIVSLFSSTITLARSSFRDAQVTGQLVEAEPKLRDAVAILEQGEPQKDLAYALGLKALAWTRIVEGRYDEAELLLRRDIAIQEAVGLGSAMGLVDSLLALTPTLLALGRPEEAEQVAERSVQIALREGSAHGTLAAFLNLASVQSALGKDSDVETACKALAVLPEAFPAGDPRIAEYAAHIDEILAGLRPPLRVDHTLTLAAAALESASGSPGTPRSLGGTGSAP